MPGGIDVTFGPFFGGLNLYSEAGDIQEDELAECMNFEVDIDGTLKQRPPIEEIAGPPSAVVGEFTRSSTAIGNWRAGAGIGHVFFANNVDGVKVYNGIAGVTDDWFDITTPGNSYSCIIPFRDLVVMPTSRFGTAGQGGVYNGSSFTTVASMPRGDCGVVFRDRVWIAGLNTTGGASDHTRLFFSELGDATSAGAWPSANFIDIGTTEIGGDIKALAIVNDSLAIFKEDSTWILSYDISPSDAILRQVNEVIGCSFEYGVCQYQNSTYVLHHTGVYEFIDFQYVKISQNINVTVNETWTAVVPGEVPFYLATLGDRLIFRDGFDVIYAYNLLSKTWSEYESNSTTLDAVGRPVLLPGNPEGEEVYLAGWHSQGLVNAEAVNTVFKWPKEISASSQEKVLATGVVPVNCFARTKNYSLDFWHTFKRLFWWGTDVSAIGAVTGTLTVNDMTIIIDTVTSTRVSQQFFKFEKGVRFRRCNFKVTLVNSDGSSVNGPCRLHHITAIVRAPKQTVGKDQTI